LLKDIFICDDLLKKNRDFSEGLSDSNKGRQEMFDDLMAEVNSNETEILSSFDVAK
jgi:hypothetical protein